VGTQGLTPSQEARLRGLRTLARLLDSAFVVPGTSYRVGLDPIIGLIPGLGDLITPLFAIGILMQARQLRVPKVVQVRMLLNVAIDVVVGVVPLAGDLFDFVWKANERNLRLVEAHALEGRSASAGDWLFVIASVAVILALASIPFFVLAWLVELGSGLITRM
jgi:hypothetical protein